MTVVVGAGIILVRTIENTVTFLLLKGSKSGVWSFPKGHPEIIDNESALRTAVRETYEETGLHAGVDYDIVGNSIRFGKRPYWIGIVRGNPTIQTNYREHSEAMWFTWQKIQLLNSNIDVRDWISRSQSYMFTHVISSQTQCTHWSE